MKGINALRGMETLRDVNRETESLRLKGINALRGMETENTWRKCNMPFKFCLKGINALRGMETKLAYRDR